MNKYSYVTRPRRYSSASRLLLILVGIGLVGLLFFVKTRALEARTYVRKLENTLEQERAELRMISAEIAHLENPQRLRRLAGDHLDLRPVKAEQVLTLEQAVAQIPKAEKKQIALKRKSENKGGAK